MGGMDFTDGSDIEATETSGLEECTFYIWITLAAILTTLCNFFLLSLTIYYIVTKITPGVKRERQNRSSGIVMKLKTLMGHPLSWCSSPSSQGIITERNTSPHPIQMEDTNQPNFTSKSKNKGEMESTLIPPIPVISLPPLPCSEVRHSMASFGTSEEEHEYDYIKLPMPKPKADGSECNCPDAVSVESQDLYDTCVPLAKETD